MKTKTNPTQNQSQALVICYSSLKEIRARNEKCVERIKNEKFISNNGRMITGSATKMSPVTENWKDYPEREKEEQKFLNPE